MSAIFQNISPSLLFIIPLYILIFYFFFIRPKHEEEATKRSFFEELALGDSVVTIGGIHGIVRDIEEDHVVLGLNEQARNLQCKVQKEALAAEVSRKVYPKEQEKPGKGAAPKA